MEVRKGYKQTDVGVFPEDWKIVDYVSFGQVIDGDRGTNYPSANDFQEDGHCLFLNAGNVTKAGFRFEELQFITAEKDKKLNKGKLVRGDCVLTTRGTVGNFAYFNKDVPFEHLRINSGMVILRNLSPEIDNRFQYLVFQSYIVSSQLERLSFGSAQPQLTVKGISSLKIPLPPTLAEQEAIAEALSDADALIESLETLLAKKRQVKQGAMSELLTGKRRVVESGEWEVKTLGDLVVLSKAGTNPASSPDTLFAHFSLPAFDAGATPIIEQGNQIGSNKFLVPENAVMISKLNPRIPRIWAPEYIPDNSICSTEFLVLVPRENINRNFLAVLCQSPTVSYQMELHAIGTTGSHQRINPSQALAIEVHVPTDKAEQTAIAEILSDMDAEIRALEGKLSKARAVKAGMMSELLTGRVRLPP